MSNTSSHIRKVGALVLALVMLFPGRAGAGAQAPAPDGSTEINLRVETPAYQLRAAGLSVPGYGANDVPGAPVLPMWSTIVELPPAGAWRITVEPGAMQLLDRRAPLPAVPVPEPVLPGPLGWSSMAELPDAVPVVDRPDPAIYGADAFYPAEIVQPGPVQWQRSRRLLPLRVFPFRYNPVAGKLSYYPDVRITVRVEPGPKPAAEDAYQLQPGISEPWAVNPAARPTAGGGAMRIGTGDRGMYRLTYDELVKAAPSVATADPATFAVSYLGQRVAIQVTDADGDGQFEDGDLIIFYAEPYSGRYMAQNVYWFTWGGTGSPAMATRTVTPTHTEPVVTEIQRTLHVENNRTYMSTISRPRDVDHWFDSPLGSVYPPISYALDLKDPVLGGQLTLRALVNSGTPQAADPDRSISMRLNGHDAGTYAWTGLVDYLATTTVPASWLDAVPNQLDLWPGVGILYPDWIEVTYPSRARAYSDRLYIEAVAPGANEVQAAGFTTPAVRVYDVRNPRAPVQLMTTQAQPDGATYTLSFWDADLPGPTYFLTSDVATEATPDAGLLVPRAIVLDTAPAVPLQSTANDADYIAIVHPSLWTAIDPLLARRANPTTGDGFRVAKVDVQDIYDEFSFGRVDPEAIRTFLAYAYDNWNHGGAAPQYVLLVGDGHYDFTGVSGTTLLNLIPPYLLDIDPWLGETAADNRFASVDPPEDGEEDYLPDMHIGRIPAQTPANVTDVVAKILAYETAAQPDDWQRRVVFVADNCADGAGDFHALTDESRLYALPALYDDRTIYYGNPGVCPQSNYSWGEDMRTAIKGAFNNQALYLQWFGHASQFRWGSVSMLNIFDPPALAANTVWPVTMSFSCWTGYFITLFANLQTLGETLLLTPLRGSVADVSPSGQHVGSALLTLNQGVTEAIFQDRLDRFGAAVDAGKLYYWGHTSSFHDVIDTSVLFGDPALRLRLPPIVSVARNGALVKLTWKRVPQYASYEVWRSTRAYFKPGDPGSSLRGTVPAPAPGPDVIFEDGGAVGNPNLNYFYVVRGVNPRGAPGLSNRIGEFDFAVTPGN